MGSIIVRLCSGKGIRLFGFLCYFAFVPGLTISLSLIASNTAGFTKKSVSSAMFTVSYCVGNIVGPFTFQLKDAPKYTVSLSAKPSLMRSQSNNQHRVVTMGLLDVLLRLWYSRPCSSYSFYGRTVDETKCMEHLQQPREKTSMAVYQCLLTRLMAKTMPSGTSTKVVKWQVHTRMLRKTRRAAL